MNSQTKTNRQIRYCAYGKCPECGNEVIRPPEVTLAICTCGNPHVEVPLKPAVLLGGSGLKRFQQIADGIGVPLEKLINGILKVSADMALRGEIEVGAVFKE